MQWRNGCRVSGFKGTDMNLTEGVGQKSPSALPISSVPDAESRKSFTQVFSPLSNDISGDSNFSRKVGKLPCQCVQAAPFTLSLSIF